MLYTHNNPPNFRVVLQYYIFASLFLQYALNPGGVRGLFTIFLTVSLVILGPFLAIFFFTSLNILFCCSHKRKLAQSQMGPHVNNAHINLPPSHIPVHTLVIPNENFPKLAIRAHLLAQFKNPIKKIIPNEITQSHKRLVKIFPIP